MMPRTARKLLGPLAGVAIVLAGAPAAHSAAGEPAHVAPDPGVVRHSSSAAEQARVREYWTPARMRAARPLGRLLDDALPPENGTTPQAAPGRDSTGDRWTRGGKVADTTGKVYLTMGSRDFTCSASVVRAGNRDTVITAAHCLRDASGAWAKNWTFVPGYDDGKTPHGRYAAREKLVPAQWSEQADDSYDFGMAVLGTAKGKHVQDESGAQRVKFGHRPNGRTTAFGYPATEGYDGRHLHYCAGTTRPDQGGTTASGMRCDMTQGSSGGPWISGLDTRTGTGTITSVVSFKYADDPRLQYGPLLGKEAKKLYDEARQL